MKKNRKFIKKIIFSILLLLCVCVPFLVHNNNVKAQTEITDLTGMTITIPSGWSAPSEYGLFNILGSFTFGSSNNNFLVNSDGYSLSIGYNTNLVSSNNVVCAFCLVFGITEKWLNTAPSANLTFNITGGTDTTNQRLIQWFVDNNATFSGGSIPEEPTITDLTNTIWNLNDTISSLVDINLVYNIDFFVNDNTTNINYNSIKFDYGAIAYGNNGTYTEVYNDTLGWLDTYYKNITITGGTDVTNTNLINKLYDIGAYSGEYTPPPTPPSYNLTLDEYEENDISFSSSSNFYYSINNTGFFVPLITSETNLPYTISDVSLITFKNDNIENDLVLYDRVTLPVSILTIVEPGQQYTLDITEDLTLWLGQAPSDNPIPPTPGDTNVVSGGYRFNTLVSSSIFGDIEEQMLDILFEENFYLYNDTSRSFDMFTLRSENTDGTGALYFCYENSLTGDYVHAGVVSSDKTYISIFTSYRTIEWETQYVSPEVYTYLIDNGNFGDYEIPPSEPSPDNPLGWLINNVNDFLQIEILPGLPIIWLIQFALIVPLCMIVLKMYFGG